MEKLIIEAVVAGLVGGAFTGVGIVIALRVEMTMLSKVFREFRAEVKSGFVRVHDRIDHLNESKADK